MPADDAGRSPTAEPTGVAAFDFDGTLVRRDSFLGFLRLVGGSRRVNLALARSWTAVTRAGTDPSWRDVVKASLIRAVLAGQDAAELTELAERYARAVAGLLTAPMKDLVGRHAAAGHRVVIVSASPELYLIPAGRLISADHVIGTRLEVGPDGRLTGRMEGANCRGLEKARRLTAWMTGEGFEDLPLWAYGDSAGDRQMLEMAGFATRVRRGRPPPGAGP